MKITASEVHSICTDVNASTESEALDLALLERITTMLLNAQGDELGMGVQRLLNLQLSLIADRAEALGIVSELESARGAIQRAGEVMAYIGTYSEPEALQSA